MALLYPVDGGFVSQPFGPGIPAEPAMYSDGKRAWWNPFPGAKYYPHFHGAIDIAVAGGTRIQASEAGTVIESYFDRTNGGGHKVRVQIRPGVSYCSNHMATRAVKVGQKVKRGQLLGTVDSTGWSTGNHDHFWVGFDDEVGSQAWPTLYNPALFFAGGAMANSPKIKPLIQYVRVNGDGVNIRSSTDWDAGSSNIFATSRSDGIYRNGRRIAGINYKFTFSKFVTVDGITVAKVTGFNRVLYIAKSRMHFV